MTEYVLDASALHHFAAADRLDVLGSLVAEHRAVTTRAVRDEIERSAAADPRLRRLSGAGWLEDGPVDGLDQLLALVTWVGRTGAGSYHRGEATVLAYADVGGATAIIDDRAAARLGRQYGVRVHGTLWLLADACRSGATTVAAVSGLIDTLRATGARYPCDGAGFERWARDNGLLPARRQAVPVTPLRR